MLALFASSCGRDEPKVSLSNDPVVFIEKGSPAPFTGFLFSVDDTEFMLKRSSED